MASRSRLTGIRSGRRSPEAQAELELAQAVERAGHARRWAYFSTLLAILAAAGAAVAIVSLLAEEERPIPAVSRGEIQQIRAELAELTEELRKSTKANRARTEKAEAASGRALEQVEGVDTELSDLSRSSAANDRRIRRLSDDLERLREDVDNLGFGDAFP
jgi:hypothetical protein